MTDQMRCNLNVYNDTMRRCRTDPTLSAVIRASTGGTVLYPAEQVPGLDLPKDRAGRVTVTRERTLESAQRLHAARPDARIAVLNFASAIHPGGWPEEGYRTQEEDLCLCSTLHPCLKTAPLRQDYYDFHIRLGDHRYTDARIYVPGVYVIKSDVDFPQLLPQNDWFPVDVITCAAPNLHGCARMSGKELLSIHKSRGEKILRTAAAHGADCMVLGAFGCGAFGNDPHVVARAYRELLADLGGLFTEVVFAVYASSRDSVNFQIFHDVLA